MRKHATSVILDARRASHAHSQSARVKQATAPHVQATPPQGNVRLLAPEISVDSLGSSHTLRLPTLRTAAAKRCAGEDNQAVSHQGSSAHGPAKRKNKPSGGGGAPWRRLNFLREGGTAEGAQGERLARAARGKRRPTPRRTRPSSTETLGSHLGKRSSLSDHAVYTAFAESKKKPPN